MFRRTRLQWAVLTRATPGLRFRQRYHARQAPLRSALAKPLYMAAGLVVVFLGLAMLLAPGPGFLVVFIGAAMMAGESYWVASALDRLELRVRPLVVRTATAWRRASVTLKSAGVVLVTGAAALVGWAAFQLIS